VLFINDNFLGGIINGIKSLRNLPILCLFLICIIPVLSYSASKITRTATTTFTPDYQQFDANRIRNWFSNVGEITSYHVTSEAGLEWPAGTGLTTVFQSGLWIAGKVDGEIRSAASEYSSEFQPGKVFYDSVSATTAGVADDPSLSKYKIYTINRGDITSDDYLNWPVADGAPVDSEGKPLCMGDQTHWYVCNDFGSEAHSALWSTAPLGLEIQTTTWGYNSSILKDVMFIRWLIINKSGKSITEAYLSVWTDPDIGKSQDDFVGCDTLLNIGYSYNGDSLDEVFGSNPPAVGFRILQGPIVPSDGESAFVTGKVLPDYKNLPMTAFIKHTCCSGDFDPPERASEAYYNMSGLTVDSTYWFDPDSEIIRFLYPGDPVTRNGYTEFDDSNPGERYYILCTGPFDMASWQDFNRNGTPEVGEPGVQEMLCAVIVGQGTDYLNSVDVMKEISDSAYYDYIHLEQHPQVSIQAPVIGVPSSYALAGIYLNPFNLTTTIRYQLPEQSLVEITAYNLLGQEVKRLVRETKPAGTYSVNWDAGNLTSGIYLIRMTAGSFNKVQKCALLK